MPDAGRVIAGSARGIRLDAPGAATRPLGDRVKQTLFAILEPDLPGATFLDLFAGCGAAGIEALSRGAAHATFVERDAAAAAVIASEPGADASRRATAPDRPRRRRRLAARRRRRRGRTVRRSSSSTRRTPRPSCSSRRSTRLAAARSRRARRVVAKHFWRDPPPARVGLLASERERRFGETTLTFYRRAGGSMNDDRGLSRLVRPDHQRPSRHRGAGPLAVFDRVIVGVLANPRKTPLLPVETRIAVIEAALRRPPASPPSSVEVDAFDGLTVDFCRARGATRSSAACAPSATSRSRCSSPTTTGSSRPRSTPSSS